MKYSSILHQPLVAKAAKFSVGQACTARKREHMAGNAFDMRVERACDAEAEVENALAQRVGRIAQRNREAAGLGNAVLPNYADIRCA